METSTKIVLAAGATAIVVSGIVIYVNRHTIFDKVKMITTKNYFTIGELTASDTAKAKKIDNTPTPAAKQNLQEQVLSWLLPQEPP